MAGVVWKLPLRSSSSQPGGKVPPHLRFRQALDEEVPPPSMVTAADTVMFDQWAAIPQKPLPGLEFILLPWYNRGSQRNDEWIPHMVLVWKFCLCLLKRESQDWISSKWSVLNQDLSVSSCWNDNEMQKLITMTSKAQWHLTLSCFFWFTSPPSPTHPLRPSGQQNGSGTVRLTLSEDLCVSISLFCLLPQWLDLPHLGVHSVLAQVLLGPCHLAGWIVTCSFPSQWKGTLAPLWQFLYL